MMYRKFSATNPPRPRTGPLGHVLLNEFQYPPDADADCVGEVGCHDRIVDCNCASSWG